MGWTWSSWPHSKAWSCAQCHWLLWFLVNLWKFGPWLPCNAKWLELGPPPLGRTYHEVRTQPDQREGAIRICSRRCCLVREPSPRRTKEPGDTQIIASTSLCPVKGKAHGSKPGFKYCRGHLGLLQVLCAILFLLLFFSWLVCFCFFKKKLHFNWDFFLKLLEFVPSENCLGRKTDLFWYLSDKLDPLLAWLNR